ncbi:MAG: hypothetical protein HY517_02280 [Candidatus Aenigmarchaeota archaeon]|nr:hypothetical protein [Candidatus Aenigmarchaeota archaeon]
MANEIPKHQIDTCVILEPDRTEDGRYCKRYLQKIDYNYKGSVSFPVISEIFLLFITTDSFNERYNFIEPILDMIKAKRIDFYAPKDIGDLLNKIKLADSRIKSTDREILACAAESKSDALITIEDFE